MHTVASNEGFRPLKKRAWEVYPSVWLAEKSQKKAKGPTFERSEDPGNVTTSAMGSQRSDGQGGKDSDGKETADKRSTESDQGQRHVLPRGQDRSPPKKLTIPTPQVLIESVSRKIHGFFGEPKRPAKQCTKLEDREKIMLERGQQTFEKLNNDAIEHVIKGELVHAEINIKKSLKLQESVMLAMLEKEVELPFLLSCMMSYAATLSNLGNLHCQTRRVTESIEVYERAVRVHRSVQGVFNHQDLSALLRNLGYAHNKLDNFGQAAECFRSALRVAAKSGQSHGVLSNIHEELLHAEKLASQEYLNTMGR